MPDTPVDVAADHLVVTTTAPVSGGASLARDPDGRIVLVDGALPGERVAVAVHERRRDLVRARVVDVLDPSPARVAPPCPHRRAGCGGCDLQHLDPAEQPGFKRAIVLDALRRAAHLDDPVVEPAPALPAAGFRTTVRAAVAGGRAGFRAGRGHDVIGVDACLIAHPAVEEVLVRGRFAGCDEVTVRVGAASGECLVVASPTAAGVTLGAGEAVPVAPDATTVVGVDELAAGRRAWIHEEVAGHRFRISARSFFQSRPDGAAALVEQVVRAGGGELAGARRVVDAYAGVGLFAAAAVPAGAAVVAVESSPSSVADARVNLAGRREGAPVTIVRSSVERWRPRPAQVVVADPPRSGLGRAAVAALARTGAPVVVLVSCDAASLGRDTALLAGAGWRHERSVLVDLFPHTHHVEVVSRFAR